MDVSVHLDLLFSAMPRMPEGHKIYLPPNIYKLLCNELGRKARKYRKRQIVVKPEIDPVSIYIAP